MRCLRRVRVEIGCGCVYDSGATESLVRAMGCSVCVRPRDLP